MAVSLLVKPDALALLAALGWLDPARRNDRDAIAEALARLARSMLLRRCGCGLELAQHLIRGS